MYSLNGKWTLSGKLENGSDSVGPMTAIVPGNIELTLFDNNLIADPYIELNAQALRPYEFYAWVFEREFEFTPTGEACELVFEGLDCYSTIMLNDIEIGRSQNALIPHAFDAAQALKAGRNHLKVVIASANNAIRQYSLDAMSYSAYSLNYEALRVRKPAHVWGWDIAPRMALGGIFRNVYLRKLAVNRWLEHFIQVKALEPGLARLSLHYHFATGDLTLQNLSVKLTGRCGDAVFCVERAVWSTAGVIGFEVDNPQLWWPRGYGSANLYQVSVELLKGDQVLCQSETVLGIRTVDLAVGELSTARPEPDFQFYVNGVPIRVHGANHVPADALHSRDAERLPQIIAMAVDLNCNMLRLWGGGIYEDDIFYRLCDEHGILIWHDFMMGCATYPQDEEFLSVIRNEAEVIVKRLRQHPSIAMWGGDNECDCLRTWHQMKEVDPNHNRLTREVLMQVLRRLDPRRPFLPSSPWYSQAAVELTGKDIWSTESLLPEQHLWGPRDYFKSDFYRNNTASFTSEIGYHGSPHVESIQKFISPGRVWPMTHNPEWDYHASNPFLGDDNYLNYRTSLMADQVREMFGFVPDNLEDFVLASQICQAEAKKYFIELVRAKDKMSGLLWWNLIDCWPQFSDAVVDYYFKPKLAYYFIKLVQKDLIVIVSEASSWQQKVMVINDGNCDRSGTYRVFDAISGEIFSEGKFELAAGTRQAVAQVKVCTTQQRLLLIEWELSNGLRGVNHAVCGYPQYDFNMFKTSWLPAIKRHSGDLYD